MSSNRFPKSSYQSLPWFFSILVACLFCAPDPNHAATPNPTNSFQLKDGDRVALIGDTFIEREQTYGYIEYALTTHYPDRNIKFRNLGWSGDTPAGASRLGFDIDSPQKGLERIREELTAFKPTVVFIGYGMASSFDGPSGLEKFRGEMNQLLDAIEKIGGEQKIRL